MPRSTVRAPAAGEAVGDPADERRVLARVSPPSSTSGGSRSPSRGASGPARRRGGAPSTRPAAPRRSGRGCRRCRRACRLMAASAARPDRGAGDVHRNLDASRPTVGRCAPAGREGRRCTVCVKVRAWPSRQIGLVVTAVRPASRDSGPGPGPMPGRAIGDRRLRAGGRLADQARQDEHLGPLAVEPQAESSWARSTTTSSSSGRRTLLSSSWTSTVPVGAAGDSITTSTTNGASVPDAPVGAAQADLHRLDRVEQDQAARRVVGDRGVDQLLAEPLALPDRGEEPDRRSRRRARAGAAPRGWCARSSPPPRARAARAVEVGDQQLVQPRAQPPGVEVALELGRRRRARSRRSPRRPRRRARRSPR